MKITKYEHACLVIEEQGRKQVIDPGVFSNSFTPTADIDCVIVTHVHDDHFDLEKLKKIREMNPKAMICTVQEVADQAAGLDVEVIAPGRSCAHGPFHTSFFGGQHAAIHPSRPIFQNVGVYVNEAFYYPGDSLAIADSSCKDFGRSVRRRRGLRRARLWILWQQLNPESFSHTQCGLI